MIKYGLIGFPLSHSFSKKFFIEKFKNENINNVVYENFELKDLEELRLLIKNNSELKGLNVTIPYKEKALDYMDEIDNNASNIGAINVIKIVDNKLVGFNSDYLAFKDTLRKWLKTDFQSKALILGTGGSSRAVSQALIDLNIDHNFVSRNKKNNYLIYDDLHKKSNLFLDYNLIINSTPLGMHPKMDSYPEIPYELISEKHYLYDLIYNPEKTKFLKKGEEKGAKTKNGLEMLYLQAELSWNYWNK